jgi:hypothetical protein
VLKKYTIQYYLCPRCGFLQTEEPYWLSESYVSAISDLDLGPINRSITAARIAEGVILHGFDPNARFIDWGGGYGILTRMMRDLGYDFYWRDPYCENIFAKKFEATEGVKYELMTSFEVFEHIIDPISEITHMLKYSDNIIFSNIIKPNRIEDIKSWWYLVPDHGQHVSFYSRPALQSIADRFGLHLVSDNKSLHMLSRKVFSPRVFEIIARDAKVARLLRAMKRSRLRKHSLLTEDVRRVTGWSV